MIGIKMATMLDRDEYIEQSYFFQTLGERMRNHIPIQETLASIREEVLSTTRLPIAVDFMLSEPSTCPPLFPMESGAGGIGDPTALQ